MSTTVRQATPLDVVNLYRLVSKQDDIFAFGRPDEARALAFVLDLIMRGHVMVAEHSGRLVGSIAFAVYPPPYSSGRVMDSEWFCVVPSYRDTEVGNLLLGSAMKVADQYKLPIRLRHGTQAGRIALHSADEWLEYKTFVRVREEQEDGEDSTDRAAGAAD